MKRTNASTCLLLALAWFALSCSDDVGLRGRVRISVSDSPVDELPLTGVNLMVTNFEAYKDGSWHAWRTFDRPVGVNLLELTGGKSLQLVDQFVEPGTYTEFRFTIMQADPSSAVLRSPLSTVEFRNGTSRPLFLAEPGGMFRVIATIRVSETGAADFNFDIDVRKSLTEQNGKFMFNPVVRVVNVPNSGTLSGRLLQLPAGRMLVYAYPAGAFSDGDSQLRNGIRFGQAVASAPVEVRLFQIGFLEEGDYDLVFVNLDEKGKFAGIRGIAKKIQVAPRQTARFDIDMNLLSQR
jgi:hypothetical protein